MNLTTQRKVYIAILGLAGTALAVDRVFLSGGTGPKSASASPQGLLVGPGQGAGTGAKGGVSAPRDAARPAGLAGARVESVADRLRMFSEPTTEPTELARAEAFVIPASWGDPFAKPLTPVAEQTKLDVGKYKLTGVIRNRADGSLVAVINGKAYRVGDEVAGRTLTDIESDRATLSGPEGQAVELHIERGLKSE